MPIQSTFGDGENRKCFILGPDKQPTIRDVKVLMDGQKAMSNDRLIAIESGVNVGDVVVLNPGPLLVGDMAKFKASVSKNPIQGDKGDKDAADKKGDKAGKKRGS